VSAACLRGYKHIIDELKNPYGWVKATAMTNYDPFKGPAPEATPRDEVFVWSFVKDVRTFTGSLRAVDDEQWEAVYLINGALYKTQVFATRVLAEHDLMRTRDALEATGWHLSSRGE
jgi:hypothetical protein